MTISRAGGLAAVLAAALLLAGCSLAAEPRATVLPSDGTASASPTPTASPSVTVIVPSPSVVPGDALDCGGHALVITAGSADTIVGDCPDVQVQGGDLTLDATGASVAVLQLLGDRLTIRLGDAGQITLAGNDTEVSASDISSLTVRGDRNTVAATGAVADLLLQGNDNTVRGTMGEVSDEGARNTVG